MAERGKHAFLLGRCARQFPRMYQFLWPKARDDSGPSSGPFYCAAGFTTFCEVDWLIWPQATGETPGYRLHKWVVTFHKIGLLLRAQTVL